MLKHICLIVSAIALLGCGDDDRPTRDSGTDSLGTDVNIPDGFDPNRCSPGQTTCAGNTFFTCGADGVSRENEVVCPEACDQAMGCVACRPGSRQCNGNVSMVCAGDGFVTGRDCAESGGTCGANGFCNDVCGQAEASNSYIGCEYWAVPLPNGGHTNGAFDGRYEFSVVVANPDSEPANVVVFRGANVIANQTVTGNGLTNITLPWIDGLSDAIPSQGGIFGEERQSLVTSAGAYRVVSDRPVTVSQFNPFEYDNGRAPTIEGTTSDFSFTNDASLLLPTHSFTTDYIASSFLPLSRTAPQYNIFMEIEQIPSDTPGYVSIVGVTQEPTTVSITASAAVLAAEDGSFAAIPRGGNGTFTIARGEVVTLVADSPPGCAPGRPGYTAEPVECPPEDPGCGALFEYCQEAEFDLTGTRVSSNQPVAVFGGHQCAYVPANKQACDHLENQMPPLQTWGTSYVTAPMINPGDADAFNLVRITGAFAGTEVTLNPPQNGQATLTLGSGQTVEFQVNAPFSINATRGIMVTQFLVGQSSTEPQADRGDPAMVVIVPKEQYRSDYTFVSPTSYNAGTMGQSYILVTRPTGLAITLDGTAVNAEWSTVGDREIGIIPIEGGTHSMAATDTFGVIVYGMGQFTSYAYPAGLNLEEITLL